MSCCIRTYCEGYTGLGTPLNHEHIYQKVRMRQSYEQNIDENYKPQLSYDECLRIVKGLEAVRKCHLTNSPVVERAARLMQHNKILHLPSLNHFIEDMAAKVLENIEQSSSIIEHPKAIQ